MNDHFSYTRIHIYYVWGQKGIGWILKDAWYKSEWEAYTIPIPVFLWSAYFNAER